jgi:predicted alpha/beta superfamily hydrolase
MSRDLLIGLLFAALAAAPAAVAADAAATAAPARPSTAQANVTILAPLAMPRLGRERTVRLYLPPDYASSKRRYPVLYLHDGQNLFDAATSFLGEWEVDEALNRLAQEGGVQLIAVGIDNGGEHRMQELAPYGSAEHGKAEGDAYLAFLVDVVKPYVDAHYRTQSDRAHTAIMGSSLGGLISHYALLRYPQVFGKAGIFSPSYWYAPPLYAFTAAHPPPRDSRWYFYAGGAEDEHMVGDMQRMVGVLHAAGLPDRAMTVHVVADAKHNEGAWRAEFARAIEWLFDSSR